MEINLPARIEVDDYHEFSSIQSVLRQFIPRIKVIEVGFIGPSYIGIVYCGSKKDVKWLIKKIKIEELAWQKRSGVGGYD